MAGHFGTSTFGESCGGCLKGETTEKYDVVAFGELLIDFINNGISA